MDYAAIVVAIVAFVGTLVSLHFNRKAVNSDASKSLSAAAADLIAPYRDEVETLRNIVTQYRQEVRRLQHYVDTLECGVFLLSEQIRQLGAEPVFNLDELDDLRQQEDKSN